MQAQDCCSGSGFSWVVNFCLEIVIIPRRFLFSSSGLGRGRDSSFSCFSQCSRLVLCYAISFVFSRLLCISGWFGLPAMLRGVFELGETVGDQFLPLFCL